MAIRSALDEAKRKFSELASVKNIPKAVRFATNPVAYTASQALGSQAFNNRVRVPIQRAWTQPVPQKLQPLVQPVEAFHNTRKPIISAPREFISGYNVGFNANLVKPITQPQTPMQKGVYQAGNIAGAFNPYSVISKVSGGVNAVTNPLVRSSLSRIAPKASNIASKVIANRVVPGLANVGQGAVIDSALGRQTDAVSAGIDFSLGLAGGKGQFRQTANAKGFSPGRSKYSQWDKDDANILSGIGDYLYGKKNLNPDSPEFREADLKLAYLAKAYLPVSAINKIERAYGGKNQQGFVRALTKELTKSLTKQEDAGMIRMGITGENRSISSSLDQPSLRQKTPGTIGQTGISTSGKTPRQVLEGLNSPANPGSKLSSQGVATSKGIISPDTSTYLKDLEKSQNSARSTARPGLKQTVSGLYKDIRRRLVDSTAPIEDVLNEAEKKGKFQVLPSQDVRLQIDRVLRAPTLAGQFVKDQGFDQVIKNAPDLHVLDQYLIAKQATKVAEYGKETGRDLAKDANLVKELGPEYEQFAQKVTQYGKSLLDYSVNTGLVSKELATQLKTQYPDYVPLNRIFNELEQGRSPGTKAIASLSRQSVVQKLKGSTREIESPVASLLGKTQTAFEQGEKNIAAQQLASYKDLPGFKDIIRELSPGENAKHTISFLENGVKKTFEVTPEIENAAKSLSREQIGLIGQIFRAPTRALQLGATSLNVGFTGANAVKDQITNLVLSKKPLATSILNPNNFVRSLFSAVKHDDLYQDMVRNAGGGTSFDIVRSAPSLSIEQIRAQRSKIGKAIYTIKNPEQLLRTAEDIIGRSEELNRIQVYRGTKQALLKEGRTLKDAELLAGKAARETTTNFARSGEWGRVLSWMVPYFNAGVQGSRTLVRNIQQRPAQTGFQMATSVFMPVAAATAWNLSDPTRKTAYEDLQDFEKEGNIIIVPPNPTKDERGKWNVIKIPLPQGISQLSSLVRRPIEQAQGLDPVKFSEVASNLLQAGTSVNPSQLASSFTPQAVKPFVEAKTNKNLFTGNPIVPEYQKDLPPEEQVNQYTSGTARKIGGLAGISPKVVENAVGTSFGGVGKQVLNASDRLLNKMGQIPEEQIAGEPFETGIQRRFVSASGGKQEDLSRAKEGQQQLFRRKAIELIVAGNLQDAKKIRDETGIMITKGDVKRHISSQKTKAIDLVIEGDVSKAKEVAQKYKIKITPKDVKASAKRKAITYIKQGNKEEAKKLRDKYKFTLTQSDIK